MTGLPTKNGTMIAVISTYVLLVFANVVLFRNSGDSKESKDVLENSEMIIFSLMSMNESNGEREKELESML